MEKVNITTSDETSTEEANGETTACPITLESMAKWIQNQQETIQSMTKCIRTQQEELSELKSLFLGFLKHQREWQPPPATPPPATPPPSSKPAQSLTNIPLERTSIPPQNVNASFRTVRNVPVTEWTNDLLNAMALPIIPDDLDNDKQWMKAFGLSRDMLIAFFRKYEINTTLGARDVLMVLDYICNYDTQGSHALQWGLSQSQWYKRTVRGRKKLNEILSEVSIHSTTDSHQQD